MSQDSQSVDQSRRRFLINATSVVGGVGAVAAAVPFVASFLPSARAQAAGAPTDADLSRLEPGAMLTVEWRGKPVWIIHRDKDMLTRLHKTNAPLRDPDSKVAQQPAYATNEYRAIKPEYLVLVGICTHLGCSPTYRPELGIYGNDWQGGFFCPCHGSKFDLSGRVYSGVPAPINLEVPPHRYISDTVIRIGEEA